MLDARWGIAQGFDTLLRRLRPLRGRRPRPRRHPAARQRGRGPGAGLAAASRPTQPFFGWVHLYDPHTPYDAPAEFAVALPRHARRRLRRRDRLHRRAGRAGCWRRSTRAGRLERHARRRARPTTASSSASTASSRTASSSTTPRCRFRSIMAGPGIDRAGRARPGAHRRRDADGAGSRRRRRARRRCRARRCARRSTASAQELLAFSETLVSALPLRLERAAGGARRHLQVHPRAHAASSTTSRADPGELTNLAATDSGARRHDGAGAAGAGRARPRAADAAKGPQAGRRRRPNSGCGRSATWAAAARRTSRSGRDAIPRTRSSSTTCCSWPARIPRPDATTTPRPRCSRRWPPIPRSSRRTRGSATSTPRPDATPTPWPPTSGRWRSIPSTCMSTYNLALAYRAAGTHRRGHRRLRAHAAARPAQRPGPFPARRHLHAARRAGQGARRCCTPGLTLEVDRPPFLVKLGEAHLELKQFDEAEKALKEAVTLRPDVPRGQYNLALVHEQRGNAAAARAAYEAEVAANPKNYGAQFNLGKLLLKDGPAARGHRALPRRGRGPAGVRRGLSVPGQGAARRRRSAGRGAGRHARALAQAPGPRRSRRSATTCWPTSTAGMGRENEAAREVARAPGAGARPVTATHARRSGRAAARLRCWRAPRAAVAAGADAPAAPPPPRRATWCIVTIDTLRADRLGAYGSTTVPTPQLRSAGARGRPRARRHARTCRSRGRRTRRCFTGRYPRRARRPRQHLAAARRQTCRPWPRR